MSENREEVKTANLLKPEELKKKVRIIPQQPLKVLDRSFQPEDLATLCKMHPEHSHAIYSDYVINMAYCRAALDDFEHWNAIAQASTGDEDQLPLALRMMGQAIGLWHQGLNGFRVPFQRALIVPKTFTRDECNVSVYQQIFVGIQNQICSHMQPNVNNPYNPILQKIYGHVFVEFERTIGPLPQTSDVQTLLMPSGEPSQTAHGAQKQTWRVRTKQRLKNFGEAIFGIRS